MQHGYPGHVQVCLAIRRWGAVLFVALTLDFPGGLAHWFSLVHIPYRCERLAQRAFLLARSLSLHLSLTSTLAGGSPLLRAGLL